MTETHIHDTSFATALGLLVAFAALAHGAHDLWAACLVYTAAAVMATAVIGRAAFMPNGPALRCDLWKPLVLLLAVFGWSAFRGANADEARLEFFDWCAAALLYFVALNTLSSDKAQRIFWGIMVPLLCIEAAIVLKQKIDIGPAEYLTDIAPGTLVNATVGACFAIVWTPLFAHEVRQGHKRFWELGLLAVGVLIALYMSTWGLICLLAAAPFYFGRAKVMTLVQRHRRLAIVAVVAAVVLIGAIVAIKFGAARFFSNPNQPFIYTSRTAWWFTALKMFKDYPLFGIGLGNYPSAYLAYKVGDGQHTFYPHSALFGVLAETGLAGLIALGVFLMALVRTARLTDKTWALWGSFLIYMLFVAMSVSYEYLVNLTVPFVLAGALLAGTSTKTLRPRPVVGVVALILAISVPLFLYPLFVASQRLVQGQSELREGRVEEAVRSFHGSTKLNPLAHEPYQELAKIEFGRYAATMDKTHLESAIAWQEQALSRNRLSVPLRQEMDYYRR